MHAFLTDASHATTPNNAPSSQVDHRSQHSRQMRKRIMAALRLASRVVVFGRKSRIGAFGASAALAVFVSASGLLLSPAAYAASTCQTGTDGTMTGTSGNVGNQSAVSGTANCVMSSYDPVNNDGGIGQANVGAGDTVTLTTNGAALKMTPGMGGGNGVLIGSLVPSTYDLPVLTVNAQTQGALVFDPTTNSNITIKTYNSTNFTQTDIGSMSVSVPANVNDQQYINMRLGTATGNGTANSATLIVDIGNNGVVDAAANSLATSGVKQTNYVEANNGGTVIWASKNTINWSANNTQTYTAGTAQTISTDINYTVYSGTFTGLDGNSYTVSDMAGLQAYNNAIIAAMAVKGFDLKGRTAQAYYDEAFAMAYKTEKYTQSVTSTITAGDEVTLPIGNINAMYVNGATSHGIIASTAELYLGGAPLTAVNGGTITIDAGALVSTKSTPGVQLQSGATGVNNGVFAVGYLAQPATDGAGNNLKNSGGGIGATVNDSGSLFTNNGIMNIGTSSGPSYAIGVSNAGAARNTGIINIGVNNDPNGTNNGAKVGAFMNGGTFTNEGEIYIGRGAQYNLNNPENTADTIVKAASYGIEITGGNANSGINAAGGVITIGTLTQNSVAMGAIKGGLGSLTNNGTININGAAAGKPIENVGMQAEDSGTVVTNNGTININGVNGIGLKVLASATRLTTATSTGIINVAGGADPSTGTRNYGVWVSGKNASAKVDGAVNLTGEGAIGVHARLGGVINIGSAGAVNFVSGSNQIGFFVDGAGSTINNAATSLDVKTQDSTLFLAANGASFSGSSSSTLTGSGAGSIVVRVHDAGSTFNSGAATINLTGEDATGVYIEGGAIGTIISTATINMLGTGVVAGIVDGQNRDSLTGVALGTPVASTSLTSRPSSIPRSMRSPAILPATRRNSPIPAISALPVPIPPAFWWRPVPPPPIPAILP